MLNSPDDQFAKVAALLFVKEALNKAFRALARFWKKPEEKPAPPPVIVLVLGTIVPAPVALPTHAPPNTDKRPRRKSAPARTDQPSLF